MTLCAGGLIPFRNRSFVLYLSHSSGLFHKLQMKPSMIGKPTTSSMIVNLKPSYSYPRSPAHRNTMKLQVLQVTIYGWLVKGEIMYVDFEFQICVYTQLNNFKALHVVVLITNIYWAALALLFTSLRALCLYYQQISMTVFGNLANVTVFYRFNRVQCVRLNSYLSTIDEVCPYK